MIKIEDLKIFLGVEAHARLHEQIGWFSRQANAVWGRKRFHAPIDVCCVNAYFVALAVHFDMSLWFLQEILKMLRKFLQFDFKLWFLLALFLSAFQSYLWLMRTDKQLKNFRINFKFILQKNNSYPQKKRKKERQETVKNYNLILASFGFHFKADIDINTQLITFLSSNKKKITFLTAKKSLRNR